MISFLEQDQKDRAYLVKIDNAFEEVKMASKLVNGLYRLNDLEKRKNRALDKAFIKALIIGLCTIKAIQNGDQIHKDRLIFIKGIKSILFINITLAFPVH